MTLPPPEWSAPAAAHKAKVSVAPAGVTRRTGLCAEEAKLRLRVAEARAAGGEGFVAEAVRLARWLAARERGLAEAIALASEALESWPLDGGGEGGPSALDLAAQAGEANDLRRELAAWCESVGEHARAAALFVQVAAGEGDERAGRMLARAGVLAARGGDAARAAELLASAAEAARAAEGGADEAARLVSLRAIVLAWAAKDAPRGGVSTAQEAAVGAAMEAASAHAASHDGTGKRELEALERAFALAEASHVGAHALARAFETRGRPRVADEVWRAHALALARTAPARAQAVHGARRAAALDAGDVPAALAAAFDARLDAAFDGEGAARLDELATRAALAELVAARLEVRVERARGHLRARAAEELARVCDRQLGRPDRAAWAWAEALAADPGAVDALSALRLHAERTGNGALLVGALARAVANEASDRGSLPPARIDARRAARAACARELVTLADKKLDDVMLAAWANERLLALEPDEAGAVTWSMRNQGRVKQKKKEVAAAKAAVGREGGARRLAALKVLVGMLARSPSEEVELAQALEELATAEPEGVWREQAYQLAVRRGEAAATAHHGALLAAAAPGDIEAAALAVLAARAAGDHPSAVERARALLAEHPHARAAAVALATAGAAGDVLLRARAMASTARVLGGSKADDPRLRAVLLAAAADALAGTPARSAARPLAEEAVAADPESVRAALALAEACIGDGDAPARGTIARALDVGFARPTLCHALAVAHEVAGDVDAALSWADRARSLQPSDAAAIDEPIAIAMRARRPDAIAAGLAWILRQPVAFVDVGSSVVRGLFALGSLDAARATAIARRALEVFGPRDGDLRDALLDVARKADEHGFAVAVLERAIAGGAEGEADRRTALARLLSHLAQIGDDEGVARALLQSAREGVSPAVLGPRLGRLTGVLSGDGELARLEAEALVCVAREDVAAAARAYRELGAARWDAAGDRAGALAAWLEAAERATTLGYPTLGADLACFAEPAFAAAVLENLFASATDGARAGLLGAEAARAALACGNPARAWELARKSIERAPGEGDALAVAERAATTLGCESELTTLYDFVGGRALGRYGRRAAHYRAARWYEGRGQAALALKHAASAFVAVPSEGSLFGLLARSAVAAGDPAQAVRAVERASDQAGSPRARAAWLLRAATIAGDAPEGLARRVDILLRALGEAPEVAMVALLRDAVGDLLRASPAAHVRIVARVGETARDIAATSDGPDGARTCVALAGLLAALSEDPEVLVVIATRAIECDADLDEHDNLLPLAAVLGEAKGARELAVGIVTRASASHGGNVGPAALRLAAALAHALGDKALRARALVIAAWRAEFAVASVVQAELAVSEANDAEATAALEGLVPRVARVEALRTLGRARAAEGALGDATELLERAVALAAGGQRVLLEDELRAIEDASGHGTDVEAQAMREAMNPQNTAAERAQHWAELGGRRERRGDLRGAVTALYAAAKGEPDSLERWSELERVAEASGNDEARIEALAAIAERVAQDGRVAVQKRLARVLDERGDGPGAADAWRGVLVLDPDDEEADQALESVIVGEARWADLADHLARRADRLSALSGQRERLRALRLRRTAILEQRLGRVQDAADELAVLLAEWPDNASALRYLADLHERMGHPAKAAPLWRRLAGVENDREVKDELEMRAARASNAAGDLDVALEHVRAVLGRTPGNRDGLTLRIAMCRARRDGDVEFGEALEQAAMHAQEDAGVRSAWLVEAAQAAARAGDMRSALSRAQKAATVAPESAATQLLARGLEYRLRGVGAPADARHTLEELGKIRGSLEPDDEALCAFLLAEALDAVHGGGAGMRELYARREDLGLRTLIALGIAERLNSQGSFLQAVPMFERTLAGDLFGLRRRGAVAMAAADAAIRSDQKDAARLFLAIALEDPDTRPAATRRLGQIPSTPATPEPPAVDDGATPLENVSVVSVTDEEERLEAELQRGSVAAGMELAALLEFEEERTSDVVRVRKIIADLAPGDVELLGDLRAAAIRDENLLHVRAVDHVLRSFDPAAGPMPAPPLGVQREQPGLLAFLLRTGDPRLAEAMCLLCESAAPLFVREGEGLRMLAGTEQVGSGSATPVDRAYELARRLLDLPKVPLHLRRSPGPPRCEGVMLAPPVAIMTGPADEDTPELRYAVGCAVGMALPQTALLLAQGKDVASQTWRAMLGAFGPTELGRHMDTPAARLAESFWHTVPPRTQRRLQQLLGGAVAVDFDTAVRAARQAARRIGLFISGDLEAAVLGVLREREVEVEGLRGEGGLRRVCEALPEVADLVRLATSREYADARWQPAVTMSPRSLAPGRSAPK